MREDVFEGVKIAELLTDGGIEFSFWHHLLCRTVERLEIHVVVEDLTCIVEDGSFCGFHDVLKWFAFKAAAGQKVVEVVDIGLQMLSMMENQGGAADDWL